MNNIIKMLIVISTCCLSACSFIYGEDGLVKETTYDYLKAKQTGDLTIPESLAQKNTINYAHVPEIGKKAKSFKSGKLLNVNAPTQILDVFDNIHIDRKSKDPAIYIKDEIDFVWSSVVDLFTVNEVTPEIQDSTNYMLNTGWLAIDERGLWLGIENKEEIDEFKAKYQIKIKSGKSKGDVHLSVARIKAQKLNEDTEQWEDMVSYWQDSAEMLNMILYHYDASSNVRDQANRNKMLAGFKVELGRDGDGNAAILTSVKQQLVWEKLPRVLENINFKLSDKDFTLKNYYFDYEPEEIGFFASLFSSEKESLPIEEGSYIVALTMVGERVAITFKNAEEIPLEASVVTKLFPTLSRLFGEKR